MSKWDSNFKEAPIHLIDNFRFREFRGLWRPDNEYMNLLIYEIDYKSYDDYRMCVHSDLSRVQVVAVPKLRKNDVIDRLGLF